MPRASRKERKLRRLKIDRRQAWKIAEVALKQRDEARMIANALGEELKKREKVVCSEQEQSNSASEGSEQVGSGDTKVLDIS